MLFKYARVHGKNKLDFKTKEVAITFYLWYNAGRNEKKPIKKHQVDELIPEWEKERR